MLIVMQTKDVLDRIVNNMVNQGKSEAEIRQVLKAYLREVKRKLIAAS